MESTATTTSLYFVEEYNMQVEANETRRGVTYTASGQCRVSGNTFNSKVHSTEDAAVMEVAKRIHDLDNEEGRARFAKWDKAGIADLFGMNIGEATDADVDRYIAAKKAGGLK